MNKPIKLLITLLAFIALAALPAPAMAANVWLSSTTAEGCLINWLVDGSVYSQATFSQGIHFSWSGNCEPGRLINGEGTLSQRIDEDSAGGMGASQKVFVGRMVDGVFDGPAEVYDLGSSGQRGEGTTYEHSMGCVISNGQITNDCVPRKRLSEGSSPPFESDAAVADSPKTCVAGPYMVFFDRDSDTITPQAAAILDNAASNYASCGGSPVLLQGHTETAGDYQGNVGLSQRRARNVRAYLSGRGIPDGVISSEAFGESRPLVETSDGVREPQNNRVEITYGPETSFHGAPGSTVHTDSAAGQNLRPPSRPGPIMEEPWNGVGKPPTSPPSESTAALADFRKTCGNSKGSEMLPHYENVFLERRSLKHGPEQWRKELPETVTGIYQCMLQVLLRHRINGVPGFGAGSARNATRRSKERPVPHLSDDQKILAEMLRQQREASSPRSEADVRFEAAQLEYEQKLAAQQKAVADYEAAQRQVEADKAAAAAKASAAQEAFARQQAAYQAEQDRYAREQAEYQAKLTGQPLQPVNSAASGSGASGSSPVAPLSPTAVLEAHNPANDATNCLEFITSDDYERRGVTSSIMGAAFRNSCPFPVDTKWCIGADRCARGYDNIATMPASGDRGISYDRPAPGTSVEYHWAGCRKGFAYRPDMQGTLRFACK